MKIAVVGSGISGLSAAWLLAPHHEVVLFEKEDRLGGHSHTAYITDHAGARIPVDTGFMVYNPLRYPNLVKFFEHFDVRSVPTSMSFSVSMDGGAFEFSSNAPDGIFADRANILSVPFYEFLAEILRFNAVAREAVARGISPHQTLAQFVEANSFSDDLLQKYLLPLVGSIWSTPKRLAREFPAAALLRFLDNHHLLAAVGHPQWRTVEGGSVEYVKRVADELKEFGADIRLNTRVRQVRRTEDAVFIKTESGEEQFDYVVLAGHADETLNLLQDAGRQEKLLLSKFKYEDNDVVLHSDESLMPRRKEAWASWNYLGQSGWGSSTKKVSLTYHMNQLQRLNTSTPVFVTLNPPQKPAEKLTYARFSYAHPLCTPVSMEAQVYLDSIQNKNRTLFCGSYFGYGFHEDGITSAIEAVRHLGIRPPWEHSGGT